jgi:hypothetical protein
VGCSGCHFTQLQDEHLKLGYACATCHSSTNAAVVTAIAGHNRNCPACHPAVNGRNRHAALNTTEFNPGNASLHRVNASLPGMRSSFVVNAVTYTWALPTASAWLKTGWTSTSVVTCRDCHTYTGTSAHGTTVTVNIDPAYPADWHTATLGSGAAFPATLLCSKCHLGSSNSVHKESNHSSRKCVSCHVGTPHGWRLPRMLAYTNDPAPYATITGGLVRFSLKSRTTTWAQSDCNSSCHGNSLTSPWPSVAP